MKFGRTDGYSGEIVVGVSVRVGTTIIRCRADTYTVRISEACMDGRIKAYVDLRSSSFTLGIIFPNSNVEV
jgi:hypothetical protein